MRIQLGCFVWGILQQSRDVLLFSLAARGDMMAGALRGPLLLLQLVLICSAQVRLTVLHFPCFFTACRERGAGKRPAAAATVPSTQIGLE